MSPLRPPWFKPPSFLNKLYTNKFSYQFSLQYFFFSKYKSIIMTFPSVPPLKCLKGCFKTDNLNRTIRPPISPPITSLLFFLPRVFESKCPSFSPCHAFLQRSLYTCSCQGLTLPSLLHLVNSCSFFRTQSPLLLTKLHWCSDQNIHSDSTLT